ncbi:hypothetical protein PR202_ga26598 [Eleusine coracana subsp. coracana]|uniref:Uncharacterized protein n=1 Tax=Eleusine coracana subsp. coracana TaxID=191504 RepID=A0AAV5DEI8_ELECO|nr:hypothetical protein PR202_ga26598 [Eleusine coracana subsp. coracana]
MPPRHNPKPEAKFFGRTLLVLAFFASTSPLALWRTARPKSRSPNRTERPSATTAESSIAVLVPLGDRRQRKLLGVLLQFESEARRRPPRVSSPDSRLVSADSFVDYPVLLAVLGSIPVKVDLGFSFLGAILVC